MAQRKTKLYRDTVNGKLLTYEEVKDEYADAVQAELPIDDDTFGIILAHMLVQNGGRYLMIKDKILEWCNDYAEYKESERFLSQQERNISIRDIYESIETKGDYIFNEIITELRRETDEDSVKLFERLKTLI